MLPWHGREAKEKGNRDKGTMEHNQKDATYVLSAFSNWRRVSWGVISISSVFINPHTKCDFWSLPLLLLYNIFQILLDRANLDHSRRFEPILCRKVYKWKKQCQRIWISTWVQVPSLSAWESYGWSRLLSLDCMDRYYEKEPCEVWYWIFSIDII